MAHKLLILSLLLILASSVVSISVDSRRESAKQEAFNQQQEALRANGEPEFAGPYCFPDRHPEKLIWIALLSFIALLGAFVTTNKFVLTFLSVSPIAVFIHWYYVTQLALQANESSIVEGFDRILYRANGFDVAVLSLVGFITVWQAVVALIAIVRPRNDTSLES